MAISVVPTYEYTSQTIQGALVNSAKLVISGLALGANTVPHGLPRAPISVNIEATSTVVVYETAAADATNLYLNASAAGGCTVYVEY